MDDVCASVHPKDSEQDLPLWFIPSVSQRYILTHIKHLQSILFLLKKCSSSSGIPSGDVHEACFVHRGLPCIFPSLAFNHLCFFIVLLAAFTLFAGHFTGRRAVVRHVVTDDIFLTEEPIGFLVLILNLFAKPSDGCVALLIFLCFTAPLLMFGIIKRHNDWLGDRVNLSIRNMGWEVFCA